LPRIKGVEVAFEQIAIAEDHLAGFDPQTAILTVDLTDHEYLLELPTRRSRRDSAADKKWPYDSACELDAIEPDDLRTLVQRVIKRHLPPEQFKVLKAAEESERTLIRQVANGAAP
jgi:hypothetical protein